MAVPAISANLPTVRQLQPTAKGQGGFRHFFKGLHQRHFFKGLNKVENHPVRVRILKPKVLFPTTAIFYHGLKIFLFDTMLTRNVYKIIKLLKKIFSFAEENKDKVRWRALQIDQKAHTILKITYNIFGTAAGAYDLLTRNEITKMAYAAVGFGVTWQPFSAAVMSRIEFCLTPVVCLKWANCASHFYVACRNVWKLQRNVHHETRYANWVILGKAALDFGIESLRLGFHIAGIATGSTYALVFSLAFLGIISNSLGMIKLVYPIKELAEGKIFFVMQLAPQPPPAPQAVPPPPPKP
ncbi:MAG: hypothetical protein LLG04_15410 [Parachlamydia sp.]|nr:hypothetical protein [Parachlamydia sp.]